jgi:hypothetical protein
MASVIFGKNFLTPWQLTGFWEVTSTLRG